MKRWKWMCCLLFPPLFLGWNRLSEKNWNRVGLILFAGLLTGTGLLAMLVFWHGGRWLPVLSGFYGG
jgi:hypothetical protein